MNTDFPKKLLLALYIVLIILCLWMNFYLYRFLGINGYVMLSLSHCQSLCDSWTPPDSSVHGFLPARILDWVDIPLSRGLPDPGTEPGFPALWANSLSSEPQRSLELILFLYTYTDGFLPSGRTAPFFCSLFVFKKSRFINLNNALGSVRDSLWLNSILTYRIW